MQRFLLIAPYFPPMGVVGAKRALNLVRHLPPLGWDPVVLTTSPDREPQDTELAEAVPEATTVCREYADRRVEWLRMRTAHRVTRSDGALRFATASRRGSAQHLKLQYLTPFDRYLWDTWAAVRAGRRLILQHDLRAIVVSADPWSGLLAGLALHRITGLPLVPDLRDPWSIHEGKMALRPAVTRAAIRFFEARVFTESSRIVVNTARAKTVYSDAYAGRIEPERFVTIRNAFDRSLYEPVTQEEPTPQVFTVAYFGSFRVFVGPEVLLEGFARFVRARKLKPEQARFVLYGSMSQEHSTAINSSGVQDYFQYAGRVPLKDAMRRLARADVLGLVVEPHYRQQIPAKLYDYLCAGRPIVATNANPEVEEILTKTGSGVSVPFGDADALAFAIGRYFDAKHNTAACAELPRLKPHIIEEYSAACQAKLYRQVLEAVMC